MQLNVEQNASLLLRTQIALFMLGCPFAHVTLTIRSNKERENYKMEYAIMESHKPSKEKVERLKT